jgi:hypothetical protein
VIFLFELGFADGWDTNYSKMDSVERQKIWKKIQQLKTKIKARHLGQGAPIFVAESGQHRVCFREKGNAREILFAGNHKQYQKWYKQFF